MALRMKLVPNFLAIAAISVAFGTSAPAQAQQVTVPLAEVLQEGPLPDLWLGDENAPVVIVEYAALTCPHCATFHNTVFDAFKEQYIDTGLVRFTVREMPIDLSQGSYLGTIAFMLARCAPGDTGFYAALDVLFHNQAAWMVQNAETPLRQFMAQVGVNDEAFTECLEGEGYLPLLEGIVANYERGVELGVNGTPTFFINGTLYSGVLTMEQLDRIIQPLL